MITFMVIAQAAVAQTERGSASEKKLTVTNFYAAVPDHQANNAVLAPTLENAEIYVLRNTGYAGWAVRFRTFMGERLLGKVSNKRYVKYEVPAGTHEFSMQFYGKSRRHSGLNLNVEAGKKYYLMMVLRYGLVINKLDAVEITAASGQELLRGLKPGK